ncbi:MAG: MarR family transcriptional regulator, partial [Candidatus Thermoplasmatota archaeon]|nr:MarR family transcriptional regulator [Candidatus Thermoplasmatota archaeon]
MVNVTELTRRGSTCTDFLTCIYDLSTSDAYVFNVLKANGTMTLDQLSQKIQRNRSTVFKSLQRLVSVGLVYKTPKTLQAGG